MDFSLLASKDWASSDSEDADYVPPPEPNRSEPRIRKRAPAIQAPSDDDDDDHDDHDHQLSEDAFLVDRQALSSSSSAAAASSSAAPSSAAAAASSSSRPPPAASSASAAALPPSGALQQPSRQPADNAAQPPANAQPDSTRKPPESHAPSAEKEHQPQPSKQTVVEKAPPVVESAAPVADNHTGDTAPVTTTPQSNGAQPPLKRARVSPPKKTIDDIWAEMNNSAPPKPQQKPDKQVQALDSWLQKPAAKPSKPFKVRMLGDLEKEQTELSKKENPQETQTPATGLEAVLGLVRGKKPATVLDGTRKQWNQFKKDDEVNEELETYKKGKERYTDRMAFLARSDVREWEFEQKGKRKRR